MTGSALASPRSLTWRDPKRYSWLTALIVPVLPFVSFGLWLAHPAAAVWWLTPMTSYVVLPVIDALRGHDHANVPEHAVRRVAADRYYRVVTFCYVPLQYGALVLACWAWARWQMSIPAQLGLVVSLGTVDGIAINTAHELGHKRERTEQWLSKIALAPSGYGHFLVEHNRGHHVRVATFEDPASARLGESYWAFWPRTVLGGLRSAWRLERRRLRLRERRTWSPRNHNLNAWALTAALFTALPLAFGPGVLVLLFAQAVFAVSLLEAVNYLEHYGLVRQKNAAGRYVPVDYQHSWNGTTLVSNLALFHLQRHSDHHVHPRTRYQVLRSVAESPQLPVGYSTLVLVALVPPLWRHLMDRRVLAHYGGDVTLANIHPPKRAVLLARYGR